MCCVPLAGPKLPGQPVIFIDEGRMVGKLEVEKIVDGEEAAS
jgi:hypothetical protein